MLLRLLVTKQSVHVIQYSWQEKENIPVIEIPYNITTETSELFEGVRMDPLKNDIYIAVHGEMCLSRI